MSGITAVNQVSAPCLTGWAVAEFPCAGAFVPINLRDSRGGMIPGIYIGQEMESILRRAINCFPLAHFPNLPNSAALSMRLMSIGFPSRSVRKQ